MMCRKIVEVGEIIIIQQEEQKLILVTGAESGGTNEYWKVNNIYDLAGNVDELTQENYSINNFYTIRGGGYIDDGSGNPVVYRFNQDDMFSYIDIRI